MTIEPWFAQPARVRGTAILLPGRRGGTDTPLLHWPATLLTQGGWLVLAVSWDQDGGQEPGPAEVRRCADDALTRADRSLPVVVVAKSLGTLALPWAVEHGLPGVWLTPLLGEAAVLAAVADAGPPTLLVAGSTDPHWRLPERTGPGVRVLELPAADHGLQRTGDWRGSLLDQVAVFDAVSQLAADILGAR